jgi:hypothetical protein
MVVFSLTLITSKPSVGFVQSPVRDNCPMRVEVDRQGSFFTNRFGGHYKTNPKLLERDLIGGCYNDSDPAAVSSVEVRIAPGAPEKRIVLLWQVLLRNGWQKAKVKIVP